MNNSNLKINSNCTQCGSCLGYNYDFLTSNSEGNVEVIPGTILDIDDIQFKNLKDVCPVNAFEIETSLDTNAALNALIKELEEFSGIPEPTRKDLKFNSEDYSISIPGGGGLWKNEYKSYKAAEKAALHEFERLMYSQIDAILLKMITEYRVSKVKPYYSKEIQDGSVYAIHNKNLSKILNGIKNILGNKLPDNFDSINIFPDKDIIWKMLQKGEVVSSELVQDIKNEFDYPSSDYTCYIEIDDRETIVGKTWRGDSKWGIVFSPGFFFDAFNELAKDLKNAAGWVDDKIEDRALDFIKFLLGMYNEELEKFIAKKLSQVKAVM